MCRTIIVKMCAGVNSLYGLAFATVAREQRKSATQASISDFCESRTGTACRTDVNKLRQWRIICLMEFIETSVFTKSLGALLSDDQYRLLQNALLRDPFAGSLIRGGGGIRKLRFAVDGRGKSGGVRVIYYAIPVDAEIYMLLIYPKSKKDSLSAEETAILRALVKEL